MRDDDNFTLLILEHIERSVRSISRLFRILISRLSDNRGDQIPDQLAAIKSKIDDNSRILLEIKQNTDRSKFETPILKSRYGWSPSCISLNDSSDDFVLDP